MKTGSQPSKEPFPRIRDAPVAHEEHYVPSKRIKTELCMIPYTNDVPKVIRIAYPAGKWLFREVKGVPKSEAH